MDNHDQIIKDAQYRKGLSIAFFNATNATIELAMVMFPDLKAVDTKAFIQEWRGWFLEEHKKYYAEVIANVGLNFEVAETIKKLEKATTTEELLSVWLSLSQDERSNDEVIKVKDELKKKYEKA